MSTAPNIVLIVMDTARADIVRPLSEDTPMPNLAEIARTGTTFASAHATAPWTLPSHGTLFSGQYPSVHQAHADRKEFDYEPTLAQCLHDHGYNTVGVSNNTWISGEFGFDRGFKEFLATWQLFQEGTDFGDVAQAEFGLINQLRGIARKFSGNPVKNVANLIYGQFFRRRNDDGAQRSNTLIERNLDSWLSDEPLFLFVNYLEPHLRYNPPAQFEDDYLPESVSLDRALEINQDAWKYITGEIAMTEREFKILRGLYTAELAYLDQRIRELYEMFTEAGVANETVFIITGDHGENIGEHGLMDHQYSLHETLMHVPLIITGPGFEPEKVVEQPVQLTDIMPTILDAANVSSPSDLPGRSLADHEEIPDERPLFAEYLAPQPEIETLVERYECQNDVTQYDRRLRSVYRNGWRYIRGSDGTEWLFDVSDSVGAETQVEKMPTIRDRLNEVLDEWTETLPQVRDEQTAMSSSTEQRLEDLGYLQ